MPLAVKKWPLGADWGQKAPCGEKSGGSPGFWNGGTF